MKPSFANKTRAREFIRAQREQCDLSAISYPLQPLIDFLHEHKSSYILAYHPMNGEPDPAPLQDEFSLLTTRTHWKNRQLTLHAYDTATELTRYGYRQPPLGTPAVSLSEVDIVLVPALAFSVSGIRLGYGGGFYDRLLENYTGITIGMTYEAFVLEELPFELHDRRVDYIYTESGLLEIGSI